MTTSLMPEARQRYYSNAGLPLAGGKVYTYVAGTSTPKATYQDSAGTVPHANPIVLDSKGEAVIYWSGAYKVNVKTSAGLQVTGYPVDNYKTDPANIWNAAATLIAQLAASAGSLLIGFIQDGAGAVKRWAQDKLRESVSVNDYGGDPTGVADSGPAFRKAAAYLESIGGGTILVPAGLYRCMTCDPSIEWPKDERYVVYIGSNTIVKADKGARFWLDGASLCTQALFTSGGNRFNCIAIKQGAKNSAVRDVRFTTNGWTLDIAFRTCVGVAVGGDDCEVRGCYFENMPGRNMVNVGYNNPAWPAFNYLPVGVRIIGNTFHNGSKNIAGNAISNDCSFIYVNGNGTVIEGNRFFNDAAPIHNCGGVEMHGSFIKVRGNTFKNLWPAIYTGWQTGGNISEGNEVSGNSFADCAGAVQVIDRHNGLEISKNTFTNIVAMSVAKGTGYPIFSTLDSTSGISSGACTGTKINANSFREDVRSGGTAINVAGLKSSVITNNTFDGFSSPINLPGAVDVDIDGVIVANNIACNPLLNPAFGTGMIGMVGSDIYVSNIKNVVVHDNYLLADVGTTNTAIAVAAGTQTTLTNVIVKRNEVVNAQDAVLGVKSAQVTFEPSTGAARIDFVPAWTQSSGAQPALGNASIRCSYKKTGKTIDVWFRFVAGSTTTFGNNATPWDFSLPVAGTTAFTEQNAVFMVDDGVNVLRPCLLSVFAGDAKFRLGYNGEGVRLDWPFASVAGMSIRGQFSYLID
jgi:hypothetical protein